MFTAATFYSGRAAWRGARDRHDRHPHAPGLGVHPGQCDLGGQHAQAVCDLAHGVGDNPVAVGGLAGEAGVAGAKLVGVQCGDVDRAGQQATAQRGLGHQPDAQFSHRGGDPLHIASPQRVLALHRPTRF